MAKKKTLKSTSLPEPQSRNEALLQNILGADYDLGEPRSRNEALLMQIAEKIGQLSEPYTAGQYININGKEISTTLHAGENITIGEDGAINAAGGGEKVIYDVGIAITYNGTAVTRFEFFRQFGTFEKIYNDVRAGKNVVMRIFDRKGWGTQFNPSQQGRYVTEISLDSNMLNFPAINGIFCVHSTVSGDDTYHFIAIGMEPTEATMNLREREKSIGLNKINYQILS